MSCSPARAQPQPDPGPPRRQPDRHRERQAARVMASDPLVQGPAVPADLLLSEAHVIDPRAGIDALHDVRVRDGEIAELAAPGTLDPGSGRGNDRSDGAHAAAGVLRPARAPAHARAGAQGGSGDRDSRRRRRWLRRGDRDAEHRSGARLGARCCARCATRPRAKRASLSGFLPAITRGLTARS